MSFHTLTLDAALHVCRNARQQDWACIRAMLGDVSPEVFAVNRYQTDGAAWWLEQDGTAVAILGVQRQHERAGCAWLVCTDRMRSFKKLLRFSRTVAANAMGSGWLRIEAHTLVGWAEAERYALKCGMQFEGLRRCCGVSGESFKTFSMVAT